jgi:DNA repair ATPase RecN
MSRLMLAIKNLLRTSKALPTVVFDEIDSGISGEIALRMGRMLKEFSTSVQIINITHLPQIAAKAMPISRFTNTNRTAIPLPPSSSSATVSA